MPCEDNEAPPCPAVPGKDVRLLFLSGRVTFKSSRTNHLHPRVLRPSSPLLLFLALFPKGRETRVIALLSAELCLSVCLLVAICLTKEPASKR